MSTLDPLHPSATAYGRAAEAPALADFLRRMREEPSSEHDAGVGATQLVSLNDSLLQDLQRFEPSAHEGQASPGLDLLEVLAAAVRHARPLRVNLRHGFQVIEIKVFPVPRLVHTGLPQEQFFALPLHDLRVLQVQPERQEPSAVQGRPAPLALLMWELALRGARHTLLPEIAGSVAYRISSGAELNELALTGTMAKAVTQLKRQASTLHGIAAWPGFDHDRAVRMLNGLYLQAALIVSRSTPAATYRDG
jgi:hypothetical protein